MFKSSEISVERRKQNPPTPSELLSTDQATQWEQTNPSIPVTSTQVASMSHWGHQGILLTLGKQTVAVLRVLQLLPRDFRVYCN